MTLIKYILLVSVLVFSLSAREKVHANFSNLEINDFIKLVSKIANKNILVNHKVNGTVDFITTTPVYDDELIGILVSVLESKGFTLVKKGSLYEVIRSTDAAKHNARVVKSGSKAWGSLMVTQAIKIEGENVDIVAAKVRYLISKTAKLMTMKESNTLLVTDYPKNIETIKKVIDNINADIKIEVKVISIVNADAKKLHKKLLDISKSLFNEKVVTEKVKIILDDNTNGIIVVATKKNISVVEELIVKLDVDSKVSNGVKIFELKNSDAKSVLGSLNEIISKQVFKDPAMKPNVSASEEINAIIAIGEPLILKGIKMIIDELDKEKYQVYVQARVVEITKSNAEAVGVKWGLDLAKVGSNGGLTSLATNFGGASPVGGTGGLLSAMSNNNLDAGFALGAALDFLEENGASKALSNPSILCVNNKESSIYVGKTISISTGSVSSATSAIPGVTNSYKREDVGLTLKIKPRVSSVDKVTLDIEVVLENVLDDGSNNASGQPVTSKQEVKTQAILRHGEHIIIGGLVKNYSRDTVSKIPFLGDIPWLGSWLFSSTATKIEQDHLIVMLTPYVIDKSEKLSQLQKELGMLENLQKQYNIDVFNDLKNIQEDKLQKHTEKDIKIEEAIEIEDVE